MGCYSVNFFILVPFYCMREQGRSGHIYLYKVWNTRDWGKAIICTIFKRMQKRQRNITVRVAPNLENDYFW